MCCVITLVPGVSQLSVIFGSGLNLPVVCEHTCLLQQILGQAASKFEVVLGCNCIDAKACLTVCQWWDLMNKNSSGIVTLNQVIIKKL